MTRRSLHRATAALVLGLILLATQAHRSEAGSCESAWVTGYVDRGPTKSGIPAGPGIAAVDPRVIPLGSRVYVEGLGSYLAADTGGGVRGCWVDVWVPTVAEAYAISGWYRVAW